MTTNNALTTPLKPSELALAIKTCFLAHRAPMLHGDPGVGKSDIVRQAADLMFAETYGYRVCQDYSLEQRVVTPVKANGKVKQDEVSWVPVPTNFQRPWFIDFRTALHDAVDITGVPYVTAEKMMEFAIPTLLPTDKRGGCFFMDEINRGPQMTQNACFSISLSGSVGKYQMPSTWVVAAAVNDKDIGAAKMSAALTRRFTHLDATTDVEDVCKYAVRRNWEPVVIAFLRMRPALLNIFDAKERVTPNRRGWKFVRQIVAQGCQKKGVEHCLFAGNIGDSEAVEFSSFLRMYKSLPSIDAIMLDPTKADVPIEPGTLYAISAALARRAKADNFERIVKYLDRLPSEFNCFAIKDAITRDNGLQYTSTFTKWAVD